MIFDDDMMTCINMHPGHESLMDLMILLNCSMQATQAMQAQPPCTTTQVHKTGKNMNCKSSQDHICTDWHEHELQELGYNAMLQDKTHRQRLAVVKMCSKLLLASKRHVFDLFTAFTMVQGVQHTCD